MSRKVCLVVLALSLFLVQTSALSYVNNETVPSDILSTIFFDEIQNNLNLVNVSIPGTGSINSGKCILALREILKQFPSLNVLPFLDSWGKFPSGILYGHLKDVGNFDQCVRISQKLSSLVGTVNGQYCTASVPLLSTPAQDIPIETDDPQIQSRALENFIKLSIGICVPDICEPDFLTIVFQTAANNIFNGSLSGITVKSCTTAEKPEFDGVAILGIVIFSIVGGLMVLSTFYDVYTECTKKTPVSILLAFSVIANGRKLFAINTKKSSNNIECLIGIRVFSMAWVLMCHNYTLTALVSIINLIDLLPWLKAASSMHIMMASVSVDSFMFMSGLLVAWIAFRELDKTKGKLNILLMYFHRYIRLTPAVAAVILFYVSVFQYIGSGPYWNSYKVTNYACDKNWWSTLLYVQNYVNPDNICVPQTWYLAVDMQLYILSPLILIPLWKWGRKFSPVLVLLSLLSIGCIIATYFKEGFNTFMGLSNMDQSRLTYYPTHARYSVWLVGIGLGYFMHRIKQKPLIPSKFVQLIGWLLCFASILAMIYGPYFKINSDESTTVFEAAMFEAFRRPGWGIALSWIVYACHFGFGGFINTLLSHPFWQPIGRLTFSLYLVHMGVQIINFGSIRTDVYFSDYTQVLYFWSTFGVSLMVAILLTLSFESPILVLEKALLGGSKNKDLVPEPTEKTV